MQSRLKVLDQSCTGVSHARPNQDLNQDLVPVSRVGPLRHIQALVSERKNILRSFLRIPSSSTLRAQVIMQAVMVCNGKIAMVQFRSRSRQ